MAIGSADLTLGIPRQFFSIPLLGGYIITARLEQMPELLGILVSMDLKIGFVMFMFKYSHQSNFHQEPLLFDFAKCVCKW